MSYPYGRNLLLSTVGFENLIDAFEQINATESPGKAQSYPPYNILKINDRDYAIEIAVAGFKSEEIDITAEGNKLNVVGKLKSAQIGELPWLKPLPYVRPISRTVFWLSNSKTSSPRKSFPAKSLLAATPSLSLRSNRKC